MLRLWPVDLWHDVTRTCFVGLGSCTFWQPVLFTKFLALRIGALNPWHGAAGAILVSLGSCELGLVVVSS